MTRTSQASVPNAGPAQKLAVLGGGAFGTALACAFSRRFPEVGLWLHEPEAAERLASSRRHPTLAWMPPLSAAIRPTADLAEVLSRATYVICALPTDVYGDFLAQHASKLPAAPLYLVASKGARLGADGAVETPRRWIEAALAQAGHRDTRVALLSGPSFAREVAEERFTALVLAHEASEALHDDAAFLSGPKLRLYLNDDPVGVELGGALKNVMAIAAGFMDARDFGENAKAAFIARALAEMTRLAEGLGAKRETLAGLSGLGDLLLTCHGAQSRNRTFGEHLGRGLSVAAARAAAGGVVEGEKTAAAAYAAAERLGLRAFIAEHVHKVVSGQLSPSVALEKLGEWSPISEHL